MHSTLRSRFIGISTAVFTSYLIPSLFAGTNLYGATVRVPVDQPTIQAGVDSATDGDTVLVADGTYTGLGNRDISFAGKNLVLRSENGPDVTIIDCNGSDGKHHRGFSFGRGEDSTAVLDGFTITNGTAARGGGAIECIGSAPTISNCIFRSNQAIGACYGGYDAGPYCIEGKGGAISFSGASLRVRNCTFLGNSADFGSAMELFVASGSELVTISNCIFSGNSGSYSEYYSSGAVRVIGATENIRFTCTNIFNNTDGDWVGLIANQANSNGNFSADPLFCDAALGDYHLRDGSPCAPQNNSCGELIGALGVECLSTDVPPDEATVLPDAFTLEQNYPNPFNPTTSIVYGVAKSSHVTLEVYNIRGQKITALVDGYRNVGYYTVVWDASEVASGVYFYRLKGGGYLQTRKMLLLQ